MYGAEWLKTDFKELFFAHFGADRSNSAVFFARQNRKSKNFILIWLFSSEDEGKRLQEPCVQYVTKCRDSVQQTIQINLEEKLHA